MDNPEVMASPDTGVGALPLRDRAVASGADAVSALRASVPSAGTFNVGKYSDGSGPMVRVRYDVDSDHLPDDIWIDAGDYSEQWIAINWRVASEFCAAVMTAAQAIEARRAATTGAVHESVVGATDAPTPPPV